MAAIGLKTHIWNNNARSVLLLICYPFLVGLIVWSVTLLIGSVLASSYNQPICVDIGSAYCQDQNSIAAKKAFTQGVNFSNEFITAWWPAIFAFVIMWFMIAYFLQSKMIRVLSHSHPITREDEPELYNMLENLCISRGMRMPRLEIIETRARNAFASGIDENSYTITVTRGLLQTLKKDEVEAVLGHELTHIINGDVRLLIVSIIFTGMIGFFAQLVWSTIRYSTYSSRRKDARVLIVILAIAAILWLGYIATIFTRFALSRRREFMADAGAIELTKNPDAMMRALLRLAGKDRIPEATNDIALMCIENSSKFFGLFATHPPLADRIEAISEITGTPIPDIKPGHRAEDNERFIKPQNNKFPWLTATRKNRIPQNADFGEKST